MRLLTYQIGGDSRVRSTTKAPSQCRYGHGIGISISNLQHCKLRPSSTCISTKHKPRSFSASMKSCHRDHRQSILSFGDALSLCSSLGSRHDSGLVESKANDLFLKVYALVDIIEELFHNMVLSLLTYSDLTQPVFSGVVHCDFYRNCLEHAEKLAIAYGATLLQIIIQAVIENLSVVNKGKCFSND